MDEHQRAKFEQYQQTKDRRVCPFKYLSLEDHEEIRREVSQLLDQFDEEQSPKKNKRVSKTEQKN